MAIEHDGTFWHADKDELDREKSLDLLAAGFTVVRLRENPLNSLAIRDPCYFEVFVYSHAPDADGVTDRVKELVDGAYYQQSAWSSTRHSTTDADNCRLCQPRGDGASRLQR